MFNFKRITGWSRIKKGGDRFLCAAALLTFILSAALFLSACGGGGSTGTPTPNPGNGGGDPGNGNPGDMMPGDGNGGGDGNGDGQQPLDPCDSAVSVSGDYDVKDVNGEDTSGTGVSICGSAAANAIKGGSGDDTIRGLGGNDTLQGREGDDEIHGGPGTDTVIYRVTTEGDGSLLEALDISLADGTAASDGHGGTDTLSGIENVMCDGASRSAAGATIIGDDQDNILQGCRNIDNDDQLIGHGGDDTFLYSIGNEFFDGGPGTDTLDMSRYSSAITVDLSTYIGGVVADPGDFGRYVDIGGNAYAKLEEGSSVKEGEGQSTIENVIGGSGDDTLTGDSDDNTLTGGAGADMLAGGAGDDTYHADSSDTITEAADEGDDTVYFTGSSGITIQSGNTLWSNIETVVGTEHADIITGPATGRIIRGAGGNDNLTGGAGADTLSGGAGADTLAGGAGDDTYHADSSDTITEATNEGDDTVYFTGTAIAHGVTYGEFSATTPAPTLPPANIETVVGTEHDDKIRARFGEVTVVGGAGNDTLMGGEGPDTLIGCGGKDLIYSNVGSTVRDDDPYTIFDGITADQINTFVIVSGDDAVDEFRKFTTDDRVLLAGFPLDTDRDDVMIDIDFTVGETPDPSDDDTVNALKDNQWVKIFVNSEHVAWVRADLAIAETGTSANATLKNRLSSGTSLVIDPQYDTKCD